MALKLDYVIRETSTNLRRNVTLNIAAVVTMAVSLGLFGSAMLLRAGVDALSSRWEEGVEVVVFVQRDISEEAKDTLETDLREHPSVADVRYVDAEESMAEYRRIFENNPAMLAEGEKNPELVPTSFRVTPSTSNPQAILSITEQFATKEGVMRATSALEGVRRLQSMSSTAQRLIFITALGLLMAALMLILNAIRMAMFARRREIEVMKLVGATNWFIRVPFMMEGVVQGVVGSGFALTFIYLVNKLMNSANRDEMSVLAGMVATRGEVTMVMIVVVLLGVGIGAVGSGWALSRFLKV
ncbi:MAG TPA: ABC transporter permease [Acidimicrobiales bacterium]|nr:ABC transporter permease [Acidimicrobiales bacterium]